MNREQPEAVPPPSTSLPARSRVDLHSHSLYSDGEYPPAEVAAKVIAAGLAAHALTDHDCLDGLPEYLDAADGFEPVCGVEISARHQNTDVHVLGLFIPPDRGSMIERLRELAGHRQERTRIMVEKLRRLGVPITEELVMKHSPQGTVGRPHIAHALVEAGAAGNLDEAFRRFLRPNRPGYVPKPGPSPPEAIRWVHEAGGAAVLAHPGLMRNDSWIDEFAAAGLDGIEVWHPKHRSGQRRRYLAAARRLHLVPSGGSDYHGPSVGDAQIGQEPVPLEVLERLKDRCPR